jgi:hypothetical protein
MAKIAADMRWQAEAAVNRIVKQRARRMLDGQLSFRFCPKAADVAVRAMRRGAARQVPSIIAQAA